MKPWFKPFEPLDPEDLPDTVPEEDIGRDLLDRQVLRRIPPTVVPAWIASLGEDEEGDDPYDRIIEVVAGMCGRYGIDGMRITRSIRLVPDYRPLPSRKRVWVAGLFVYAGQTCLGMVDSIKVDDDAVRISSGTMAIVLRKGEPTYAVLSQAKPVGSHRKRPVPFPTESVERMEPHMRTGIPFDREAGYALSWTDEEERGKADRLMIDPADGSIVTVRDFAKRHRLPLSAVQERLVRIDRAYDRIGRPLSETERAQIDADKEAERERRRQLGPEYERARAREGMRRLRARRKLEAEANPSQNGKN